MQGEKQGENKNTKNTQKQTFSDLLFGLFRFFPNFSGFSGFPFSFRVGLVRSDLIFCKMFLSKNCRRGVMEIKHFLKQVKSLKA